PLLPLADIAAFGRVHDAGKTAGATGVHHAVKSVIPARVLITVAWWQSVGAREIGRPDQKPGNPGNRRNGLDIGCTRGRRDHCPDRWLDLPDILWLVGQAVTRAAIAANTGRLVSRESDGTFGGRCIIDGSNDDALEAEIEIARCLVDLNRGD